jgi:hypothetical protein
MPLSDLSDQELLKRAVQGARAHRAGPAPRWVAVMDTFSLGSTYAAALCRRFGLGPDEVVQGAPVTVRHVDGAGESIAEDVVLTGKVGASFVSEPVELEGWTLKVTPENAEGVFGESAQTVTYVYDKRLD